jgi:DNA adenine methylase
MCAGSPVGRLRDVMETGDPRCREPRSPLQPANVSTVPLRSPFRYPGGKTWLIPFIRQWLSQRSQHTSEFIEPFAGGAIVGLTVAFEHLADHVTLVELDANVAAVWHSILYGNVESLTDRIEAFEPTAESVAKVAASTPSCHEDRAFRTIVKNRVNRGGIMTDRAGRLNKGEMLCVAGKPMHKGLRSRWYPTTLRSRILAIAERRAYLSFIERDGVSYIENHMHRDDIAFFIDPPYTFSKYSAGHRLYDHSYIDHERIFALMRRMRSDFLATYEDSADIRTLAEQHSLDFISVEMKTTHHRRANELILGRSLDWAR